MFPFLIGSTAVSYPLETVPDVTSEWGIGCHLIPELSHRSVPWVANRGVGWKLELQLRFQCMQRSERRERSPTQCSAAQRKVFL